MFTQYQFLHKNFIHSVLKNLNINCIHFNKLNKFCVKKAFKLMNFAHLTLSKLLTSNDYFTVF